MVLKFIDREPELASLGRAWAAKGAQFYIVYGRRRIGKTELLLHFAQNRPHFYFLARDAALELERERFRDKLSVRFDIRIGAGDWEDIFSELAAKMPGRVAVIIDEFSNWIARDRGIVSVFQGIWDNVLKDKDIFLVLLGSYVGLMETEVLGYKSLSTGEGPASSSSNPWIFRSSRISSRAPATKSS